MMNEDYMKKIYEEIDKVLSEKDSVREVAIKSSRAIGRLSARAIWKIHKGEDPLDELKEAKEEVWHLKSILKENYPDIYYAGYVLNALQEFCEAQIFYSIVRKGRIPSPSELSVHPEAYLLGLADVIGELRRTVVENLRAGNIEKAEEMFVIMESIYELIMQFSYPNAIVPIKNKQDAARNIIERTRADIMVIKSQENLRKELENISK